MTLDLVKVLQFLVLDRTIKRGSRVSSLIQIELALEISHTCSNSAQDSSKNSRKHLEERKLEERIKSKSIQQKNNKHSLTGKTDAWASVQPKDIGCIDALASPNAAVQMEIKVEISTAPVGPMLKEYASAYSPYYHPESMFWG